MAKLSLSNVLYNRRRMNYLTILCALLLVFFLGSILVAKNPNKTRADVRKVGNSYIVDSSNGCSVYNLWGDGLLPSNPGQQIEYTCGGSVYYNLPEDADLIITDGVVVTTYSLPGQPVKLNSLTVTDDAKLTHEALTVAESNDCDAVPKDYSIVGSDDLLINTPECTLARAKKVDIEALASITLSVGGNIDVYEKGYPGGSMNLAGTCLNNSYGPGRGGNCVSGNPADNKSGIGGSFGGLGDNTFGLPAANVGTTYSYIASSGELEFGSGAGAVYRSAGDFAGSVGGSGGGRIKLKANQLTILPASYISADGGFGITVGTQMNITGGGGSGGAIVINVQNIDVTDAKNSSAPAVTDQMPIKFSATVAGGKNAAWGNPNGIYYGSSHYGSDGVIRIINASADLYQISAQGGRACGLNGNPYCSNRPTKFENHDTMVDGSGGGGGWIVVQSAGDVTGVSINKTLSPLERPAGTSNISFNPYALKMGDVIKVTLDVYNMTAGQTYTISDEFLTTKNVLSAQSCDYQPGSALPSATTIAPGAKIVWNLTAVGDSAQLSYECKVGILSVGDPIG